MSTEPTPFRDRLVATQPMSPTLRDEYAKELDAILYQTHTARSRIPGAMLLLICVAVVIGEIRAMFVYHGGPGFYTAAVTMLIACLSAGAWVARDLWRGRSARKDVVKVADLFYGASSILTVVALLTGFRNPHDPASTFSALFMLVFFIVCTNWSFSTRITSAELTVREQCLRLESRIADLAERLPK